MQNRNRPLDRPSILSHFLQGKSERQYQQACSELNPMTSHLLPTLQNLPTTLPTEGAIRIELEAGIPIFRASQLVQDRIETLLDKQQTEPLTPEEIQELDSYEAIDDYLSLVNRTMRNLYFTASEEVSS